MSSSSTSDALHLLLFTGKQRKAISLTRPAAFRLPADLTVKKCVEVVRLPGPGPVSFRMCDSRSGHGEERKVLPVASRSLSNAGWLLWE